MKEFLTVKEMSEIFRVSSKTVYAWVSLRKVSSVKIGKSIRIPRDECEEWLETTRDV